MLLTRMKLLDRGCINQVTEAQKSDFSYRIEDWLPIQPSESQGELGQAESIGQLLGGAGGDDIFVWSLR